MEKKSNNYLLSIIVIMIVLPSTKNRPKNNKLINLASLSVNDVAERSSHEPLDQKIVGSNPAGVFRNLYFSMLLLIS
jgi:hypothetical protein